MQQSGPTKIKETKRRLRRQRLLVRNAPGKFTIPCFIKSIYDAESNVKVWSAIRKQCLCCQELKKTIYFLFTVFFLIFYNLHCKMKLFVLLLLGMLVGLSVSLPVNQQNKRRPVPTDKLPLPALPEDPDKDYDPKARDINDDQLIELLGVDYLPDFMSPTKPRSSNHTKIYNHQLRISPEVRKLAKTLVRSFKGKKKNKKSKRMLRKIQGQIAQVTACPVRYRWKDLGIRFWPRYVKEGHCDSSYSCSIPAGMQCRPTGQTTINILRWYCQGILEQKYCLWVNVKYPITSECKCQCWKRTFFCYW